MGAGFVRSCLTNFIEGFRLDIQRRVFPTFSGSSGFDSDITGDDGIVALDRGPSEGQPRLINSNRFHQSLIVNNYFNIRSDSERK